MKVAHVVNSFDPACDVLRCVRELNKHSAHSHSLYVKDAHPLQHVYQYEQPPPADGSKLVAEADVIIHHFAGWEDGLGDASKPSAFRNINTYYSHSNGKFWTAGHYNAATYTRYKLLASSHVGATDFMPAERFRWLPDLLPLDGAYSFNPADRQPAVSYIKHWSEFQSMDFGDVVRLDCHDTPHASVLERRSQCATVVIDNVSDGHFGLAGQEAAILGLPVVVFNHPRTLQAMDTWEIFGSSANGVEFPFLHASTVEEALEIALLAAPVGPRYRHQIRKWSEKYLDPRRLIGEYWDPFIRELAS